MPCDRTADFLAFSARVALPESPLSQQSLFKKVSPQTSPFHEAAASFNAHLKRTAAKLLELNKLARQRSIYSDKTVQIQELTYDVKRALTGLNGRVEKLEEMAAEMGRAGRHSHQHYLTVTDMLKCKLLDLTKEFKDILIVRTENMKRQDERRSLYSCTGTLDAALVGRDSVDIEIGEQVQLVARRRGLSAYAQSRAEAVENVQRVIGELATIFQRVATMITHQDEMIQRIDQNIDTSMHNVRQGQTELLNYYHRISSNRTLIMKVFAILFAFIVFFVFFLS